MGKKRRSGKAARRPHGKELRVETKSLGSFSMDEGMPDELAKMLRSNGIDPAAFLDDMIQRHLPKLQAMGDAPGSFFVDKETDDVEEQWLHALGYEVFKAKTQRGQNKILKEFLNDCDPDHDDDLAIDVAIRVCRQHATEPRAFLETLLTHARGYMKKPRFQLKNWPQGEIHPTAHVLDELVIFAYMTHDNRLCNKYLEELQKLDPDFRGHPPHTLISCLMSQGDYIQALTLVNHYWDTWFEGDAFAYYNKALLAYLSEGPTKNTDVYLKSAFKFLPEIATMLVQNVDPHEMPEEGYTSEEQAIAMSYLRQHLTFWREKPGAVAWVRETLVISSQGGIHEQKRLEHKQRLCKQRLRQAEDWPQSADAEIVINSLKDPDGKWVVFGTVTGIGNTSNNLSHIEQYDHKPKPAEMLGDLMEIMSNWPDLEDYPGMRPGRVIVCVKSLVTSWKKRLEKLGIDCVLGDEQYREVFDGLQKLFNNASDRDVDFEKIAFDDLRSLELAPEASWELFARKMPTWTHRQGKQDRLWTGIVVDLNTELLIGSHVSQGEMSAEDQAKFLIASILKPIVPVPPVIPGKVCVCDQSLYEILYGPLSELGSSVELVDSFEMASGILEDMAKDIAKDSDPGPTLVNIPGVTERHFDDFYEAADLYYRQKPWRYLDDTQPIEIVYQKESDQKKETHYAIVMGGGGLTFGLAFYFTWGSLVQLMEATDVGGIPPQPGESMSIIYGEQFEIPIPEFDMIEKRRYPIENSEAYPLFMRIRPGRTIQVPLIHELEKITACLNGVSKLVERQLEPTTVAVNLAGGKHLLSLSVKPMK